MELWFQVQTGAFCSKTRIDCVLGKNEIFHNVSPTVTLPSPGLGQTVASEPNAILVDERWRVNWGQGWQKTPSVATVDGSAVQSSNILSFYHPLQWNFTSRYHIIHKRKEKHCHGCIKCGSPFAVRRWNERIIWRFWREFIIKFHIAMEYLGRV